jgi:hypothetical protein
MKMIFEEILLIISGNFPKPCSAPYRKVICSVKMFYIYGVVSTLLPILTYSTDLIAMAACLWLAFYLFARGYPSGVALRLVAASLALAVFYFYSYNDFFIPIENSGNLLTIMLVIASAAWFGATFQLLPQTHRDSLWRIEYGIYFLTILTIIFLLADTEAFDTEIKTNLYIPLVKASGITFVLYGCQMLICAFLVPFNVIINPRAGHTPQGRFLIFSSMLPLMISLIRFVTVLTANMEMEPRVVQNILLFSTVFVNMISVARYQSMVERRTILEELPLTTAIVAGSALGFGFLGLRAGLPLSELGSLTAFVVTAIGVYDLGREFLDRRRVRGKNDFRRQLRTIDDNESSPQDKVQHLLQEGLNLLCDTLQATGGIVAIYRGGKAIVTASRNSARIGTELTSDSKANGELWHPEESIPNIEWMSSIYEGQNQIAQVGLGASKTKMDYSSGDLELFMEFADHAGTIVSIDNLLPHADPGKFEFVVASQAQNAEMNSEAEEMLRMVSGGIESELVKMVEDALRRFSDFVMLGQSPLADRVALAGVTHLERGKQLQNILREAVDALRPGGSHPAEYPIPRVWYSYLVLHDAYVKGVSNRDIMAKLYISKGTFDRTRRSALRGVARWMAERFMQR